jgi:hypothetical protein
MALRKLPSSYLVAKEHICTGTHLHFGSFLNGFLQWGWTTEALLDLKRDWKKYQLAS